MVEPNERLDPEIPEGNKWLRRFQTRILGPCLASTDHFVAVDLTVSNQVECLGTVLSLLDRLSSCYWGCHQGNHMKEYLLARACTSTSAAWILVRHGHYDAALGIARDVGEIANLLMLFAADGEAFERWIRSDDRGRMRDFKPSKVRQTLEQLNVPIPVGKDIYKVLSERATHVTPNTRPELHNNVDHPLAGGSFQADGVRICLAHIGFAVSMTALAATRLIQPAEHRGARIVAAASALIDARQA
ncbi:MAG TPA: hypothetical protein VN956_17045 [Pyrinomonadaceae bacterium]|nr:hypothetical protein [Pyrinomonadaceae bacterium]